MTWYAHHVYAEPTPAVIEALQRAWPDGVHHVPDLDDHLVRRQEVYARVITADGGRDEVREVVEGPRLPAGGLVVVRELCEPGSAAAEWFGDDAMSWLDVPPDAAPLGYALPVEPEPPAALLAWLRALSRRTGSVVSLICTSTWGGDLEGAVGWVFDGAWDRDHVLVSERRADETGRDVRVWTPSHPDRPRVVVDGDVLTLVLVHHGVLLTDGFFQLFTRAFPWERYLLAPT